MGPIPFKKNHLLFIPKEEANALYHSEGSELLENYPSFTWLGKNGNIIGCGGINPVWEGRWGTWAFMEPETRFYMRSIISFVKLIVKAANVPRLEAQVLVDFPQGIKFARMIGFTLETPNPMRHWLPDGRDVYQFVLIGK